MPECDYCGEEVPMPYTCRYCGGSFCPKHRLPENHNCTGLGELSKKSREEGRIYRGINEDVKRGPEGEEEKPAGRINFRIGGESGPQAGRQGRENSGFIDGPFALLKGFFFQRATTVFLLLMFATFIVQLIAQAVLGDSYHIRGDYSTFLYYLTPSLDTVMSRPWTLLTSIFVHGGFYHIFINSLVLFFIGSPLERKIGRNKFILLFLVAGIVAALAQILVSEPDIVVLGASGAILGCLGGLTAISPRSMVLLFFFIPMPLWMLTLGYGAISAILAITGTGGGIGHMAHFAGLIFGLAYGYKIKKEIRERR